MSKKAILASEFFVLMLIIAGCNGIPEPIKLDSSSAITINQDLIRKQQSSIPLDPFLKNNNWTYNLEFTKTDGEYIPNDMVIKAFYVAQNADKIIIIGNKQIATEYKKYLIENGCKNISIHQVDSIGGSKEKVNILFFGSKKDEK